MKVVEVSAGARRDACLAMLCAEVHGREGGLDALVSYAGVRGVWFENEMARLFALVDDAERIHSAALLVLDENARGLNLALWATPTVHRGHDHGIALVSQLADHGRLQARITDSSLVGVLRRAGINDWLEAEAEGDQPRELVGMNPAARVGNLAALDAPLRLDRERIKRSFKARPKDFETYKNAFVRDLEHFARHI